jgi:hypothetical protein
MFSTNLRHVGDSNVECVCPSGFKGIKCEIREFFDEENGKFKDLRTGRMLCNADEDSNQKDKKKRQSARTIPELHEVKPAKLYNVFYELRQKKVTCRKFENVPIFKP